MTRYMVLLPTNETFWAESTPAEKAAIALCTHGPERSELARRRAAAAAYVLEGFDINR